MAIATAKARGERLERQGKLGIVLVATDSANLVRVNINGREAGSVIREPEGWSPLGVLLVNRGMAGEETPTGKHYATKEQAARALAEVWLGRATRNPA